MMETAIPMADKSSVIRKKFRHWLEQTKTKQFCDQKIQDLICISDLGMILWFWSIDFEGT